MEEVVSKPSPCLVIFLLLSVGWTANGYILGGNRGRSEKKATSHMQLELLHESPMRRYYLES